MIQLVLVGTCKLDHHTLFFLSNSLSYNFRFCQGNLMLCTINLLSWYDVISEMIGFTTCLVTECT